MLAACDEEAAQQVDLARPVKTISIEGVSSSGLREFPGRIDANRQAELAFRVRGAVNAINVREGEIVSEGQTLAELDKTDYQIIVNNQQAQFENAEKNYRRGQDLISSGAISRMDFDRMEASYKIAQANLEASRQDLAYTSLNAPYSGVIAKRHVENFEQVLANQRIFTLQEVGTLAVKVDLPERLVRRLRRTEANEEREAESSKANVVAYFTQNPQKKLSAEIERDFNKGRSQHADLRSELHHARAPRRHRSAGNDCFGPCRLEKPDSC